MATLDPNAGTPCRGVRRCPASEPADLPAGRSLDSHPARPLPLISAGLLLAVWVAQQTVVLPDAVQLVRKSIALALILSAGWVVSW